MIKNIIIFLLLWYSLIVTFLFFTQSKMFNQRINEIEKNKEKPKHKISL